MVCNERKIFLFHGIWQKFFPNFRADTLLVSELNEILNRTVLLYIAFGIMFITIILVSRYLAHFIWIEYPKNTFQFSINFNFFHCHKLLWDSWCFKNVAWQWLGWMKRKWCGLKNLWNTKFCYHLHRLSDAHEDSVI